MIDINAAFILFANCDVLYDGRAQSTLETGNYLIIRKADGSIQIQAANKTTPRNYQSSGAVIEQRGHILISRRKKKLSRSSSINYSMSFTHPIGLSQKQ